MPGYGPPSNSRWIDVPDWAAAGGATSRQARNAASRNRGAAHRAGPASPRTGRGRSSIPPSWAGVGRTRGYCGTRPPRCTDLVAVASRSPPSRTTSVATLRPRPPPRLGAADAAATSGRRARRSAIPRREDDAVAAPVPGHHLCHTNSRDHDPARCTNFWANYIHRPPYAGRGRERRTNSLECYRHLQVGAPLLQEQLIQHSLPRAHSALRWIRSLIE